MMTDVYFGEISDARKEKWDLNEQSPFNVLKENHKIWGAHTEILQYGREHFHDMIQVDWGSFAWKCSVEELEAYLIRYNLKLTGKIDLRTLDRTKQYGVVFIEMC